MDCPNDRTWLEPATIKGVAADRCGRCGGIWLAQAELARLEATVEPDPGWRGGMVEWDATPSDRRCPACREPMKSFNYRGEEVLLETCTKQHGYWLDRGDVAQLREAMKQRVDDLKRAQKAEAEWNASVRGPDSTEAPSWWDRIKRLLRR
jgi:Zn-finger nucleic acid-binding protein